MSSNACFTKQTIRRQATRQSRKFSVRAASSPDSPSDLLWQAQFLPVLHNRMRSLAKMEHRKKFETDPLPNLETYGEVHDPETAAVKARELQEWHERQMNRFHDHMKRLEDDYHKNHPIPGMNDNA